MSITVSIDDWEIQSLLRAQLEEVSGIPDENNRAWENKTFEPNRGEPWIEENFMQNEERLTANNELMATGMYWVNYYIPINSSVSAGKAVAKAIKVAFKPTTVLSGDQSIRIEKSQLQTTRKYGGVWLQIPIHIYWKTYSI